MLNILLGKLLLSKRVCYSIPLLSMTMILTPAILHSATSSVPKSGQVTSYSMGDDGDLQKGVSWPSPRFTDHGDGTLTDNLTSLVWLKDANCFSTTTWADALTESLTLSDGDCSLLDNSSDGDWRIPNIRELESLIHLGMFNPALPDTAGSGKGAAGDPFNSLQLNDYWSSTTNTAVPSSALTVSMQYGHTLSQDKKNSSISALFVRDNNSVSPVAEVYATGQTLCYNDEDTVVSCGTTGQDGEFRKGMIWPVPRFTDNGDGTVTDNLTGLIWLQNANCWGVSGWTGAVSNANLLTSGSCGLSDNSKVGDWRVPNRKELNSLIDYGNYSPALSNTTGNGQWVNNDPFISVQPTSGYWSSSTYEAATSHSWYVDIKAGIIGTDAKNKIAYVWPVRNDLTPLLTVSLTGDGSGTVTSSPEGITCPGKCSDTFTKDDTVTLSARADVGSRFEGWSLDSCANNVQCQIRMSDAQSVSATFTKNSTTVSSWMLLLTR